MVLTCLKEEPYLNCGWKFSVDPWNSAVFRRSEIIFDINVKLRGIFYLGGGGSTTMYR